MEHESTTPDLRTYLGHLLAEKCQAQPGYSLRTFAKTLGMDSTALSRILKGERKITRTTFAKLAERLGLDPIQMGRFEPRSMKKKNSTVATYGELAYDTFLAMSHWYYLAMLELPYLK